MPRDEQRKTDPFSGMRLSNLTTHGPVEQRLFGSALIVSKPSPANPEQTTPSKGGSVQQHQSASAPTDVKQESKRTPVIERAPFSTTRFDLNDDPRFKASYNYTNEELIALDELRMQLQHELDKKVTKNDLMRSALHMLLEDHAANGNQSYVRKKIRRR